jgi:hypothetical protein
MWFHLDIREGGKKGRKDVWRERKGGRTGGRKWREEGR